MYTMILRYTVLVVSLPLNSCALLPIAPHHPFFFPEADVCSDSHFATLLALCSILRPTLLQESAVFAHLQVVLAPLTHREDQRNSSYPSNALEPQTL
jgi:hypothetical protein